MQTLTQNPTQEEVPVTTKTFRGRSLEAVLAQIRAELGEDAVVMRCSEALTGGFLGFFRRACVEAEAASRPVGSAPFRAPAPMPVPEEAPAPQLELRTDRATATGLASPGVQLLVEQASPFADQLRVAQTAPVPGGEDLLGAALTDARLYGPQPAAVQTLAPPAAPAPAFEADPVVPAAAPAAQVVPAPAAEVVPEPLAPVDPAPAVRPLPDGAPTAARTAERQLVHAGVDSALAAEVVGEALVHGLPFAGPRQVKKLVRGVVAQRLRTLHRGAGSVTLAVTGPQGASGTTLVGQVAAAYAGVGAAPVVVAVRPQDGGAALRALLEGLDARVEVVADGAAAARIAGEAGDHMVLVDLPPLALGGTAEAAALAEDLAALGADELHLALPATTSAASADELAELLEPLGLTHVALTQMDDTRRPGGGLGYCLRSGRGLSYVSGRGGVTPASATAIAQLLLP